MPWALRSIPGVPYSFVNAIGQPGRRGTTCVKGWVMDDEAAAEARNVSDEKYFDEQLERIRDPCQRRKFYQKITDLYATTIEII